MRLPEPFGSTLQELRDWASGFTRAVEAFRSEVLKRYVKINENSGIDVTGRVKVGEDVSTATNGQIRYNSSTNKFQGYANGVWVDFH